LILGHEKTEEFLQVLDPLETSDEDSIAGRAAIVKALNSDQTLLTALLFAPIYDKELTITPHRRIPNQKILINPLKKQW
jgi:hypothetical protein